MQMMVILVSHVYVSPPTEAKKYLWEAIDYIILASDRRSAEQTTD